MCNNILEYISIKYPEYKIFKTFFVKEQEIDIKILKKLEYSFYVIEYNNSEYLLHDKRLNFEINKTHKIKIEKIKVFGKELNILSKILKIS